MSEALDKAVVETLLGPLAKDNKNQDWLRGRIANIIALAKSEGKSEGIEEAAKAVEAEPELPGHAPDEIWEALDRIGKEEFLRWLVRGYKSSTARNIRAIDPLPSAVGGWRPIADAPKDGTRILAGHPGEDCVVLYCEADTVTQDMIWVSPEDHNEHKASWNPTLWRPIEPLPTPPVNEEDL